MSTSLTIEKRALRPRSLRNQLRREGKIPAIVYGYGLESTPIAVDDQELTKILREQGTNGVITMTIDGQKINTLLYKAQLDTFTRKIKHAAFLAVNMKEKTEVEAEILLVGEAVGVKAGGVLTQNLYQLVVSATPDQLPDHVEVDVSQLEINDALTVGDLPKQKNYTIITDAEEQIVSVMEAKVEEIEPSDTEIQEPELVDEKE